MSSNLAGNLAVLGSASNPIVTERVRHEFKIGFRKYAKACR
jgi:hypothetical protein